MDASTAAGHSERPRTRRGRTLLAVLISFALVLSFFHGWHFDGDDGQLAVSITQTSCDASGKAPTGPAPMHGDHCLAHMASVAPQDAATAIEYITRGYGFASTSVPDAADRSSPFKPPRA